ncbi:unnamed protein product, partial [Didymodactylos carnosus]
TNDAVGSQYRDKQFAVNNLNSVDVSSPTSITRSSIVCDQTSITIHSPTGPLRSSLSELLLDKTPLLTSTDKSLAAIEAIVEKHFTPPKATTTKKRLISGINGKSVTDLDEYALIAIKQKMKNDKQSKKATTTPTTKKATKRRKQHTSFDVLAENSNDVDMQSTGDQTVSLVQPPTDFTMAFSPQPNNQSFQPLQHLSSLPTQQCQQCIRAIWPWDVIGNCNQCNGVLCWVC